MQITNNIYLFQRDFLSFIYIFVFLSFRSILKIEFVSSLRIRIDPVPLNGNDKVEVKAVIKMASKENWKRK